MLVDLLASPDFKAFLNEVEGMIASHRKNLESASNWEETARTQSAILALRAVIDLPQQKIKAAVDAEKKRLQQPNRRTT